MDNSVNSSTNDPMDGLVNTDSLKVENRQMEISRRDAMKIGATAATAGAALLALQQLNNGSLQSAGAFQDSSLNEQIVRTTCALCPSGCGLDVRVAGGKAVKVEGSPLHPLNQGVCCLRGQASLEVLYSPERIQKPRRQLGERGSGDWEEISWDQALSIVVEKLTELHQSGQAHTVALMHGELRGQMRTLVERFMSAYGSPNVISSGSLGSQATRQAMLLTQGINGLPVYDLNNANYVMTFGGNLLESSRNVIGYLGSTAFMRRGRPQRGKLVAVHPRLSLTGLKADEWVPIRPETYAALALGMANVIINSGLYDKDFVRDFTFGFEDFEDEAGNPHKGFKSLVLEQYTLERASMITGVATETIARLAGEFATNHPAVAVLPTEFGEYASGNSLYTSMAVHALNALVGSIDCPGGVLVQRFPDMADWPKFDQDAAAKRSLAQERLDGAGSVELPLAISAYQNVAERILADEPYALNVLILLDANPVYDVPNNGRFIEALLKVPFVVSFASTLDESAAHADLILPASTFLEIWGDDYIEGTGYAGVSLRQPVVGSVHDTRNPGDVLLELASSMAGVMAQALPWSDYKSLVEYRLSGVGMDWDKFVANGNWSELVYFNAEPGSTAWANVVGRDRLNAPKDGRFDLFSRELFALINAPDDLSCLPHFEQPLTLKDDTPEAAEYPLLLVSQSIITHTPGWHGIIPTLQESYGLQMNVKWGSWVEVSPRVAEGLGVKNGDLVWVESRVGRVQTTARIYEGLWPNAVFIPPGQGHHTLARWGRDAPDRSTVGVNPNQLAIMGTEALSGQVVFSPVRVRVYKA